MASSIISEILGIKFAARCGGVANIYLNIFGIDRTVLAHYEQSSSEIGISHDKNRQAKGGESSIAVV